MGLSLLIALLFLAHASFAETGRDAAASPRDPHSQTSSVEQPSLSRLGVLTPGALDTDTPGDVCFMLRTYRVEREAPNSEATRVVAHSRCQRASKFTMKKADQREPPLP